MKLVMPVSHYPNPPRCASFTLRIRLISRYLAIALFACLASPFACAVGIGELTLKSHLFEPLHAQVELQLGQGEAINDSCLSLSAAEYEEEFFPTGLTVSLDSSRRIAVIRTRKPFIELFAIFRLKIQCRDMGSVSKTLTLLPEFGPISAARAAAASAQDNAREPDSVAGQNGRVRASQQPAEQEAVPLSSSGKLAADHANRESQSRLTLSGGPLDLSRIRNAKELKRELLALQKLFDEDDQTARLLTVQNQVSQMQEELKTIKQQLGLPELKGAASVVADTHRVNLPAVSQPAIGQVWRTALIALGLLVAILLTWLGLRYVARRKSQVRQPDISTVAIRAQHELQILNHVANAQTPLNPNSDAQMAHAVNLPYSKQTDLSAKKPRTISEAESEVMEEAELYAVHGHADKGIKILQEFVGQHPTSEKAWILLLSICSSRGQAKMFESAARKFLLHNKNSTSWVAIQALGRTLDRENPLYLDENNPGASVPLLPYFSQKKHRLIGDILVELNYLSSRDIENLLKDFDPKLHGRFGNYLVMSKQVSYAQLGEALMKQQADSTSLQSDSLPTLQQMEDLLKDFNPQRDGSVEEFLMSRKILMPTTEGASKHVVKATGPESQVLSLAE